MAVRRALTSAFALLLALGLALGLPLAASAYDTVAFTIDDERITESSGLATDGRAGGYWTSNDSGDDGIAFRLDPSGRVTGTLEYRAAPIDVEAVAMHEGRLFLADIGDNAAERDRVTVYTFSNAEANDQTVPYRSWEFRYPDGAHDAETLLIDRSGRLYLVTKGMEGGIYRAPKTLKRTAVNELDRVGDAPAGVTDGTFLPDGDRIALLALNAIHILDRESYAKVAEVPSPVAAAAQAESLAVSLDQTSLLVGTEGRPAKVYAVPIPAAGEGSPGESPTATPSGTASSDAGEPEPEDEVGSTGQSRARTLMALGLAGLVAIVAGGVVALVRR